MASRNVKLLGFSGGHLGIVQDVPGISFPAAPGSSQERLGSSPSELPGGSSLPMDVLGWF